MKTIKYKPTNYPSDLTDKEWASIERLLPMGKKY